MGFIWGIPYLFIKIAVGELSPATLVFSADRERHGPPAPARRHTQRSRAARSALEVDPRLHRSRGRRTVVLALGRGATHLKLADGTAHRGDPVARRDPGLGDQRSGPPGSSTNRRPRG